MSDQAIVSIHLLGKKLDVRCEAHEVDALEASARYLEKRMHEQMGTSIESNLERIAVVTALNLVHEKMHGSEPSTPVVDNSAEVNEKLRALTEKLDDALGYTQTHNEHDAPLEVDDYEINELETALADQPIVGDN